MGASCTRVVKFIRKGDTGPKGDQGAVLRGPQAWSDCAVGYAFKQGAVGEAWLDVVLYNDYYYLCKKSHVKTASNYPGSSTAISQGLWQLGDAIDLVATKLLLAQYALVKNLGVETIDMRDANNAILFQAKNGVVTCKTGTFENVTVTGTINATSGKIAGFTISGNGLSNTPFDNDAYIIFRNDAMDAFAGIGGNILPASSGARAVARFENHDNNNYWGLGTNYALLVSARNGGKNVAIQMDGGALVGLAYRNTIIGTSVTSRTLTRTEGHVICINSNDCTIYLPTMQLYDSGHVVRMKWLSGKVKIKVSYCYTPNGTSYRYTKPCIIYDRNDTLDGADSYDNSQPNCSVEFVWVPELTRTVGSTTYYGAWLMYKFPRDW